MKLTDILIPCIFASVAGTASAAEPAGYYSSCEGKYGANLLRQLESVVGSHKTVSYDGLWNIYPETDSRPDGTVWDMYSTQVYRHGSKKCGSYKNVGDCYNREHSFPKSWFDERSPMKSDAFHVYPTDGKVNGQRSNHPYGECANGTTLPAPGNIKALGKLGASTFPGYSGTVFEPDDEYKGDFARTYFYMAAAYNSKIGSWSSPMLANNAFPAYKSWAVELLLKWHRQDPVSSKERERNDAVYRHQNNRNPFIDHPEMAEHIWGKNKEEGWSANPVSDPTLELPAEGHEVNIGTTVAGVSRSASFTVKGVALAADVNITSDNSDFAVSPAVIGRATAQSADGVPVTVTFTSATAGTRTATITVSSGSLKRTVKASATVVDNLPAGPVTGIGDHSFGATWSYVGDADSNGEYTLDVRQNGVSLDEFPCAVRATDEYFLVENLDPSTTYTYTVKSRNLVSDEITVTTLAPQPSVEFWFDGELRFTAVPGERSEVAELLVYVDNIDTPVTISVDEPFQLSTDKATWTRSLLLQPEEDRIYLCMNAQLPGTFHSSITATAGDYINDDVEITGISVASTSFIEDFEEDASKMGSYTPGEYQGSAAKWKMTNAGIFADQDRSRSYENSQSVRLGKNATSTVEMTDDCLNGFGTVSLVAAVYGSDADVEFTLEYSTDSGANWTSAGTGKVTATTFSPYTFTVNAAGPVRMRVRQTSGARWMLDQIEATSYSSLVPDFDADYHRWDAFCRDGRLVIEASETVDVRVYALDGTVAYAAAVAAGSTAVDLPAGLYIVAVDDFGRRVLVK